MTPLQSLLSTYRNAARTEREKGTYFEQLIAGYLKCEPVWADLYSDVWMFADWARAQGVLANDTGIDLVARTRTGEFHAVQCKLYAEDHTIQKKDIDSFFTASGKKTFSHRIIVSSTARWSANAEEALIDQQPPVTRIDLHDLEASQIDWSRFEPAKPPVLKQKKTPRPHQVSARNAVVTGLAAADRGKLIMACGTGKTFAALKIAETMAGADGRVLFLVPSLALLSQTLTEWTQESAIPLHSFAVCSDADVGKRRSANDDLVPVFTHELRYPATTDAKSLADQMKKRHDNGHMSVVFSTYHSIDVVGLAQKDHGLPDFDLVICDEAHRTTGVIFEDKEESAFVKVHDDKHLGAKKRLYMTATPRVYGVDAKTTAERDNMVLCSMDDPALYGEQLYVLNFSNAVKLQLLVDYKVLVLAVEESHVSRSLQKLLAQDDNQLKVDDAAKIVGCWKALSKQGVRGLCGDPRPMKRAVAFCQVINPGVSKRGGHKVASKQIAGMFEEVVQAYQDAEGVLPEDRFMCTARHVDGTMNAVEKEEQLSWLKDVMSENTCRILSNVRCLSEGVDVPALDAVLFLTPRNSQVDVVQSVGRVMRTAPGKNRGYVILPVVIPAGVEPHVALNDNETYRVVWQVLQALRSHDDRFDAMINKMDLDFSPAMLERMEVISVVDRLGPEKPVKTDGRGRGSHAIGTADRQEDYVSPRHSQMDLQFEIGEIERAIYAKVVQKCGNRHHWEEWANDIAKIARTHIDRIHGILENPAHQAAQQAFAEFADELRDDLNDAISNDEIVEMLAQHLITKPVFDALFKDYSFASRNPVSTAMQKMLDVLQEHRLDKETDILEGFYESVRMRADGIENAAGKQKIVLELYDKFFRNAFPKMTERLGIVYTPVEVVDFIIHSVDHLLKTEFQQTLGSKGVHIIDPFTGTGTFITRLLQSGLIGEDELPHKFKNEIHANEIVLLAYYIAAINIEATYHAMVEGDYVPFEGICLTDTFQLYEKEDLISRMLVDNSSRRNRQKKLDIRVIIGNPPYSIGQKSENDNADNVVYPHLDERIRTTYAAGSNAMLSKGLYDSYIRAIRWASDRVGKSGIIGFVTNAGFTEANTADGLRQCLAEEFSSIYVFHLRGNQRTSGETSRKEGGKIFGSGSRAPIAITFLVKNPEAAETGKIFFHDIGDYLTREEKLEKISRYFSVDGITGANGWTRITPDAHGDWLRQRDDSFNQFMVMGDKKGDGVCLFQNFSLGVVTNRDAWCWNLSRSAVANNMTRMIAFYNSEVERFHNAHRGQDRKMLESLVDGFINTDGTQISWTRALKADLVKGRRYAFEPDSLTRGLYRPFAGQWMYFNRRFNEMVYQMPRIFPDATAENLVIGTSAPSDRSKFCALMTDKLPSLHAADMVGAQYFPLYLYDDAVEETAPDLFNRAGTKKAGRTRREAITDNGLAHFQAAYPGEKITKEDIFYYVYGLLHSPAYREKYADNLSKELPRIPCVKKAADFWKFSKSGRALAALHIDYETVDMYPATVEVDGKQSPLLPGEKGPGDEVRFRVEKMRWGKQKIDGKARDDKTTLIYNNHITVTGIPEDAQAYVVNGKSALDWVVERQCVKTDKDSGIVNDANDWAIETMHNPRYPLELFLRVITVSLETMKIVNNLPALDIGDQPVVQKLVHTAKPAPAPVPKPVRREAPSLLFAPEQPRTEQTSAASPPPKERTSLDEFSDEDLLPILRAVMKASPEADRMEVIREMSRELGFQRAGKNIQERLQGMLNTASKRQIISQRGEVITRVTASIADYDNEWLAGKLSSLLKKNELIDLDELCQRVKTHLGFERVRDAFKDKIETALKKAINTGELTRSKDGIGRG